ncbi:MAG: lipopolysaccharide core heptose(I) kinase RfaP [Desulfobacteraceae bacterium]
MINLPQDWIDHYNIKEQGFDKLFGIEGPVYKKKDGRRTFRFKYKDEFYFGKFHKGVGWKKIMKNLLQFRRPPVLSAKNEWKAIQKLESLGIDTMTLAGYGKKGINPAKIESFVITEELKHTISLENYCKDWAQNPPTDQMKKALIKKVATIARIIHENGLNHRDFYICHFLLDISMGLDRVTPDTLKLFLIDLHRVQLRRSVPWRWRAKDISALLFSSLDLGLSKEDLIYFASIYKNSTPEKSISDHRFFWWLVNKRAKNLYKKEFKKEAPSLL